MDDLIKICSDKRQKMALKQGKRSSDHFEVEQVVRVQDTISRNWHKKGEIVEAREADDGQNTSFLVKMENGRISTRHRVHLKPNVTRNTRIDKPVIRFNEETQTMPQTTSSAGMRTRSKSLSESTLKSCLKAVNRL